MLDEAKRDSVIAIRHNNKIYPAMVMSTTPCHLITNKGRFSKRTGKEIGGDGKRVAFMPDMALIQKFDKEYEEREAVQHQKAVEAWNSKPLDYRIADHLVSVFGSMSTEDAVQRFGETKLHAAMNALGLVLPNEKAEQ